MVKKFFSILFFSLLSFSVFATHNRAGEITFRCLDALSYYYEVTVTTYTRINCPNNSCPDRCELTVNFGDGDSAVAPRSNGGYNINRCNTFGEQDGVDITPTIRWNIYITKHHFPGPGSYYIWMEDINRNSDIINISSSVNTPFYIRSLLFINALLGTCNSSPVLTKPPIDNGCIGKCFYHNPGAIDPDGDSLSYSLALCLGANGVPVQSFTDPYYPQNVSVNAVTGDLSWCTPQPAPPPYTTYPQEYNFAMIIHEWKKAGDGHRYEIGNVERDLQVDINNCSNDPPVIANVNDTCVIAGTNVSFNITANDPNNNLITLSASGAPMNSSFENPVASFTTPPQPQQNTAMGTFAWQTNCNMVRKQPYQVIFEATDNNSQYPLSDIQSVFIKVISPAPQNLTAVPQCDSMKLSWSIPSCDPNPDHITGYKIYRLDSCDNWNHSFCETGVPAYTGYILAGTVSGANNTSFSDHGLTHGIIYAYHVVTVMIDGAESYASNRVCAELLYDVPVITNVDVISTGSNDSIRVKWLKPVAGAGGLDTIAHPGPYVYKIYRDTGYTNAGTLAATFSYPNFLNFNVDSFIDINLQTDIHPYVYHIQLFAQNGADALCETDNASSVYLSDLIPNDNRLTLNWHSNVPWTNYKYYIYRKIPLPFIPYTLIDSTVQTTYTDLHLANGRNYCYKIKAYGKYPDPSLPVPLINWSEEKCGVPQDHTAPCSPVLSINSDCDASMNTLSWNNPNISCTDGTDDVISYNLFYTPTLNGDFQFIAAVPSQNILSFIHDSLTSVAGCYVIAAVDSFGNQSAFSPKVCVDNCPNYDLPNVFTPNGDGINDLFIPFPYKYVKDIELKIFNRWGGLVFETTDARVLWDGRNMSNKELCSDGVYYFTCKVNEIKLSGIESRMIKGFVQILSGKSP